MGNKKKIPSACFPKSTSKFIPANAVERRDTKAYYKLKPLWRFTEAWRGNSQESGVAFCGADEFFKAAPNVLGRMRDFESQTWNEILVVAKDRNHEVFVSELSKDAQRILGIIQVGLEKIVSLRFSNLERMFGKIDPETGAFSVLLWDPKHSVYPSPKKHT